MPARCAEVASVALLAGIITIAIAFPVLSAPSDRLFGMELVGRHHDPFTVIGQFSGPIHVDVYLQPLTDIPGALIARATGAVAAHNWLILLSFPLSAVAAYLLARHLALTAAAATIAAMAYAFSPFHVAHAAYHPHIAQTQWLPLYFFALWRCLDIASPRAIALLVAATIAVTLSNFYGGLIAAVLTPAAVAMYWMVKRRSSAPSVRALVTTVTTLLLTAGAGIAYAWYAASPVVANRASFAFPREALFPHSALAWSYVMPPAAHPMLGSLSQRVWHDAGVREGLLEQQVTLGWGIIVLALIAVVRWLFQDRTSPLTARVPLLLVLAAVAFACSLSPEWTVANLTVVRPSSALYELAPMFRAYARFGVVVQLMAVLLAGIGVDFLRRTGSRVGPIVCVALVSLVAFEYAVAPAAQWRDVLPTRAHRWLLQQPQPVRALDCTQFSQESASVQWLTKQRVTVADRSAIDCTDPNAARQLATAGYTHLLVRRSNSDGEWFVRHTAPDGLRLATQFDDGVVFAVSSLTPVFTTTMTGFFKRERDREWWWHWMEADAAWTVVNTSTQSIDAAVNLEVSAFHHARDLQVRLAGRPVQMLRVEPERRVYRIGPLTVQPGEQRLEFHAIEPPEVAGEVAGSRDSRRLSFALGAWNWVSW